MTDRQMIPVEQAVELSLSYLDSPQARECVARDPYWPKWDSPWWHMTLLWEMGLASRIPATATRAMVTALQNHYIPSFPLSDEDLPEGVDPHRGVACHCAVGTMHQVLSSCGVPVEAELPWLKRWLLRYQLPDGGLNCDAAAYSGSRKSSLVSTLPALEAVLRGSRRLSPAEEAFVDRGARYLIAHKLARSLKGALIDPQWLKVCFPRFYEYDILRGWTFLVEWGKRRGQPVPEEATAEARALLSGKPIRIERDALDKKSLRWNGANWIKGEADGFPLLESVGRTGLACGYLRPPDA